MVYSLWIYSVWISALRILSFWVNPLRISTFWLYSFRFSALRLYPLRISAFRLYSFRLPAARRDHHLDLSLGQLPFLSAFNPNRFPGRPIGSAFPAQRSLRASRAEDQHGLRPRPD